MLNFIRSKHTLSAFNLKNYRSLISVKGPDSAKYLQGLITNDIYHLNSVDPKLQYSMILNNRVNFLSTSCRLFNGYLSQNNN